MPGNEIALAAYHSAGETSLQTNNMLNLNRKILEGIVCDSLAAILKHTQINGVLRKKSPLNRCFCISLKHGKRGSIDRF